MYVHLGAIVLYLSLVLVIMFGIGRILLCSSFFFFQAEDGIRDLVRSRGLGDVYKRQMMTKVVQAHGTHLPETLLPLQRTYEELQAELLHHCLLYTSDAADERSSVDLGGRRIIKKKTKQESAGEYEETITRIRAKHGQK